MNQIEETRSGWSKPLHDNRLRQASASYFPGWKLACIFGIALAWILVVHSTPLREILNDWQQMKAYLDQTDPYADVVFVGATTLLVGIGFPRLSFCLLGGLAFGFVEGLILSHVGTILGACIPFFGVRKLGFRASAFRRWGSSSRLASALLQTWPEEPSIWSVFLLRQAPINGLLVNLFLGLGGVRTRTFLIGTGLGFLPQACIATLVGSGMGKGSPSSAVHQLILAVLLAGALALLAKHGWDGVRMPQWSSRTKAWLERLAAMQTNATRSLRQFPHRAFQSIQARYLLLLTLLAIILFGIRLSAPPDLEGYAQYRNAGYVMDTLTYGNWWVPLDLDGQITSNPPLHTWVAAGISVLTGFVNRFTLAFPSFLSGLATAWLLFFVGKRFWGNAAGFYAGLVFLASPLVVKHLALVRPDALFTFIVALAAWMAFEAWQRGGGWTGFWLVAAAATLTKGPLGLGLASCGLLATLWERADGRPFPIQGRHTIGLACYLGLLGLWAILAWKTRGSAVIDKMIFDELLGHVGGMGRNEAPGAEFWKPLLYMLGRFAPWCLLVFWAVRRVTRTPHPEPHTRRWERFLICWLGFGLLGFSLGANHRADHLLPLFPAAALLAGAQLHHLSLCWSPRMVPRGMTFGVATLLIFVTVYYHETPSRRAKVHEQTVSMKRLAKTLKEEWGEDVSIVPVDTPATLQLYLKDFRRKVSAEEAVRRLQDDDPTLVAVRNLQQLYDHYDGDNEALDALLEWPMEAETEPEIYIVGQQGNVEEF